MTRAKRYGLFTVGVLAALGIVRLIWDGGRNAPLLSGLLEEQPAEANRIQHPRGFSIIKPNGWIHQIDNVGEEGPDATIWVFASTGRYTHAYMISRVRCNLELDALDEPTLIALYAKAFWRLEPRRVRFQGQDAVLRQSIKKGVGFENPSLTSGVIHFRRDHWCYQIRYDLNGEFSDVPPGLWRFFETLEAR